MDEGETTMDMPRAYDIRDFMNGMENFRQDNQETFNGMARR